MRLSPGVVRVAAELVDCVSQHADTAERVLITCADGGLVQDTRAVQDAGPGGQRGTPGICDRAIQSGSRARADDRAIQGVVAAAQAKAVRRIGRVLDTKSTPVICGVR